MASDSRREVKIPVFGSDSDALAINCPSRYGFAARDEVCTAAGNTLSFQIPGFNTRPRPSPAGSLSQLGCFTRVAADRGTGDASGVQIHPWRSLEDRSARFGQYRQSNRARQRSSNRCSIHLIESLKNSVLVNINFNLLVLDRNFQSAPNTT